MKRIARILFMPVLPALLFFFSVGGDHKLCTRASTSAKTDDRLAGPPCLRRRNVDRQPLRFASVQTASSTIGNIRRVRERLRIRSRSIL